MSHFGEGPGENPVLFLREAPLKQEVPKVIQDFVLPLNAVGISRLWRVFCTAQRP